MGFKTEANAGLSDIFSKKLDTPNQFKSQWIGDDFCVTWGRVANAGGYRVTYDGKTQDVTEANFKFKPSQKTGSISVQAIPSKSENKYKASNAANYSFSFKELPAPTKYSYYQDGEALVFTIIDGRSDGGYKITNDNNGMAFTIPSDDPTFYKALNAEEKELGFIDNVHISVRALPDQNDINKIQSPVAVISDDFPITKYIWINDLYNASLLSKNDLEAWMKGLGGSTPTITNELGYTVVTFTVKDSNNSGIGSIISDILGSAIDGAVGNVIENSTDIYNYSIDADSSQEMKERAKTATEGSALAGAITGIWNNRKDIFSGTDRHISYYYLPDKTDRSAVYMTYDYMVSNNKAPDFSDQDYDNNEQCYKIVNTGFNRIINLNYEKKKINGKDRWLIYCKPASYYKVFNMQ